MNNVFAKIHPHALSLASALVTAVVYLLCLIGYLLFPGLVRGIFDLIFHGIDWAAITLPAISFWKGIIGLVLSTIITYVLTYITIALYNRYVPSHEK